MLEENTQSSRDWKTKVPKQGGLCLMWDSKLGPQRWKAVHKTTEPTSSTCVVLFLFRDSLFVCSFVYIKAVFNKPQPTLTASCSRSSLVHSLFLVIFYLPLFKMLYTCFWLCYLFMYWYILIDFFSQKVIGVMSYWNGLIREWLKKCIICRPDKHVTCINFQEGDFFPFSLLNGRECLRFILSFIPPLSLAIPSISANVRFIYFVFRIFCLPCALSKHKNVVTTSCFLTQVN